MNTNAAHTFDNQPEIENGSQVPASIIQYGNLFIYFSWFGLAIYAFATLVNYLKTGLWDIHFPIYYLFFLCLGFEMKRGRRYIFSILYFLGFASVAASLIIVASKPDPFNSEFLFYIILINYLVFIHPLLLAKKHWHQLT